MTKTSTPVTQATSTSAINRTIRSVRASGQRFNTLVDDAINAIIQHTIDYGDCTGAARLLDAMPKSTKRVAAQRKFQLYSPINVHPNKLGVMAASLRSSDSKAFNNFDIEGARANPWYELPEATAENLMDADDFQKGFDRFIAKWKKIAADEAKVPVVADRDQIGLGVANLERVSLAVAAE